MNIQFVLQSLIQDYRQICLYYRLNLRSVNFEISDSVSYWGQYDPKSLTVKMTKKLIANYSWPVVLGVLKHELAHHYVHEVFKNADLNDHGPEFLKACEKLGVPPFFRRAQVDLTVESLDWKNSLLLSAENPLFEKVKKLMALACSENPNEAQLASQKIQELITKNQITHLESPQPPPYQHMNMVFKNSRVPLYIKQIISILVEHFYVYAVFQTAVDIQKSTKIAQVELLGRSEDLLIAESVFHFLEREVHNLFLQNRKLSAVDKKSLAWGFLDGFSKNLLVEREIPLKNDMAKALVLRTAEEKLVEYSRSFFPRLRNTGSRQRINQQAYNQGHEIGKKVKLRQVIEHKKRAFGQLLGFKS